LNVEVFEKLSTIEFPAWHFKFPIKIKKTNDPDPSFKIEKWRMTKVFGGNHDLIYYGNWTANDSKYELKVIDGVQYFIIKNFSVEDGKYCYYIHFCTFGPLV
jgi:hypothetical protein